jgi:hypothetical protein
MSPQSLTTLAECLATVDKGDRLEAVIDEVTREVVYWQCEYQARRADRLHNKRLRSELRKIAKANTVPEARDIWLESHQDTRTACTLAAWNMDDEATMMDHAAYMLDNIRQGMVNGRPSKAWRAPMVHCFDSLWVTAAGNVGSVYEGSPRLRWINALVECVEGVPMHERNLRELYGKPFTFVPAWDVSPRAFELHSPQSRQA